MLIIVHVSGCCCFSDINISQGSVVSHLRDGGIFLSLYYKFTAKSVGKKSLKIDQYMAKLAAKL